VAEKKHAALEGKANAEEYIDGGQWKEKKQPTEINDDARSNTKRNEVVRGAGACVSPPPL
jgi:hypothetical protein